MWFIYRTIIYTSYYHTVGIAGCEYSSVKAYYNVNKYIFRQVPGLEDLSQGTVNVNFALYYLAGMLTLSMGVVCKQGRGTGKGRDVLIYSQRRKNRDL